MSYERRHDHRDVVWAGSVNSNEIGLRPGATYTIDLPSAFAGSTLTIEGYSELDSSWKTVNDPGADLPVSVVAGEMTILPATIYLSGLDRVRFVSDSSETCEGRLLLSW